MMTKEEFTNGLLERQEAKKEAEAVKAPANNIKAEMLAGAVSQRDDSLTNAKARAFDSLIELILSDSDSDSKLIWFSKGILSVIGG